MPRKQSITRLALARRLQSLALSIAAGQPVRVGRTLVRIPDRVIFETEIERSRGEMELDLEVMWSVASTKPKSASKTRSRGVSRSTGGKKG